MSLILKAGESPEGSHWYTWDGQPAYDAKLTQARKDNLLPSVTTILKVLDNQGLERWKTEQAVLAALTLPRFDGEDEQAFARRVIEDAGKEGKEAAEEGERIHAYLLERKGHGNGLENHLACWERFEKWNVREAIYVEEVAIHPEFGYAGRVDLIYRNKEGRIVVGDIKTRNRGNNKHLPDRDKDIYQLAAYARTEIVGNLLEPGEQPVCQSILIDRSGGEVETINWTDESVERGWNTFYAALRLWTHLKNYEPSIGKTLYGRTKKPREVFA